MACGGGERLSERRRNEEQKRARGDKGFWALGRRTEANGGASSSSDHKKRAQRLSVLVT